MPEVGIYSNTGRRVKFDESVDTTSKQRKTGDGVESSRTVVKTIRAPSSSPPRPVSPSPKGRSWSPLRRSRRKGQRRQLNAPDGQSVQGSVQSSEMSNSLATSSVVTPNRNTKSVSPQRQRRGWFGRSQSSHPSPKKQRNRRLTTVDESDELKKETGKLVRALTPQTPSHPLSSDSVQEAYLAAVDLQQEAKHLREGMGQEELKGAQNRIQQLQQELKAAQKAASQLATKNSMYEEQQENLVKELEHARSRVEEMGRAQADDASENSTELQSLREQLNVAKRTLEDLQAENEELKKNVHTSPSENEISDQNSLASVNDSFELQLSLQKDLAQVTARVHALETENKSYAEKQQRMDEALKKVDLLEEENSKLTKENSTLKEQLAHSQSEMTKALIAAKSAPSHKDMVLSSSQLATATTIIGRLTEECKTLTLREKELNDKLKRLETKNKNQKEIFQTALEIKQVEMKIYEQEARMNARKVEELNDSMTEHHYQQASIVSASPAPPSEDFEMLEALRGRLNDAESRLHVAEALNEDLEDKIETLQGELAERKARVSQLEEKLQTETETVRQEIEQEKDDLARQVAELGSLIRGKEGELQKITEELEDERKESEYRTQVRVNELTEQLNDYEVTLEERETRIHALEEKLAEQETMIANGKTSAARSVASSDEDDASQTSSKLNAIRRKMGTYENLMRAKMNRIQEIDQTTEDRESPNRPTSASASREESPPPMMVFATPVNTNTRVTEMEATLKASDERIEELRAQLADAQLRLAQVQEAHEQASDDRYTELEASLKCSEDRITDLREQLCEANHGLAQAQNNKEAQQRETEITSGERDETRDKLDETQLALQESTAEVTRLRTLVEKTEAKLEGLQTAKGDSSRDESTQSSTRDQAEMNALEEELEDVRQRYEDECDMRRSLVAKVEVLVKDRDQAHEKLQQVEFELLERENNMEQLVNSLDETKALLEEAQKQAHGNSSQSEERFVQLETELKDATERLAESDMKIEMLEQFIEEEASLNVVSSASNVKLTSSSMQAEADIKRKDEEMQLLRSDVERKQKELLRSRERVENLEMERNYSTAKLKELSTIVKAKSSSEAEVQLYNKCIECAELSADKDDLSNKLRSSEAQVKRLEQEIKATQQMINDISQSWDTAASADENVSRLKKEHGESVSRATTLSIQLAESQMQIDKLVDKLASAERANKAYAEELNGRPGILRAMAGSRSSSQKNSRHNSPERRDENLEVRKLKQRIALLEDQNAAYEASLSAFSALHETSLAM